MQRGGDEYEGLELRRVQVREVQRDLAAETVPDEVALRDLEREQHLRELRSEQLHRVRHARRRTPT